MLKIYEILQQHLVNGDVGIEIEVEGRNLQEPRDIRWVAVEDGSLRGESKEYVLKKPIMVDNVKDALTKLKAGLAADESRLDFSFRTSVHVHVNCQDLYFNQYLNFIYTYFLLEEPLMNFCGKGRKGNRFCLRLVDAEGVLDTVNLLFVHGAGALGHINQDQVRYAAINLASTQKFGSLEFRGMEGNLDVERLDMWAKVLVNMREFSKGVDNPKEIFNMFADGTPALFMERVLGKRFADKLSYPGVERDIQNSLSLSIDLPFSFRDRENEPKVKMPKPPVNAWLGGLAPVAPLPRGLAELVRQRDAMLAALQDPREIIRIDDEDGEEEQ